MWKDESIRKGVIASVIASLIVIIFITPFLNFIWGGIANGGTLIQEYYVNSVYKNASLGNRNWLAVIFYLYFLSFLCGGLVIVTFWLNRKKKELLNELTELGNEIKEEEPENRKEPLSDEQLAAKIEDLKKDFSKGRWRNILTYVSLILFFFLSILSYFRAYSDLQLNATFEQRIKIVAPFIDEQKEEELNLKASPKKLQIVNQK